MISWITTVGWSPFAVINPIWAYCKEYLELPEKVIIIHTQNRKIEENLDLAKRYIINILQVYSNYTFKKENIVIKLIENEDIQTYADNLRNLIQNEIDKNPKKIILDMTPGRKYMSAINVYYGLKDSPIPIQVFYLHLEERKYQDVAYPLTPIIKYELVDIIESTEVFTEELENLKENSDNSKLKSRDLKEILSGIEDDEKLNLFIALTAIKNSFQSFTKISKFFYALNHSINRNTLIQVINNCKKLQYINSKQMRNQSTEFTGYYITSKGKKYLGELNKQILTTGGN